MKSWTQNHEGSFHRSEPPMIGDDIDNRDDNDSQSEENDKKILGNLPFPKLNSLLDGYGDKYNEQKRVTYILIVK